MCRSLNNASKIQNVYMSYLFFFSHFFRNLIDSAIQNFGKIDILILNAGISAHFKFEDVNDLEVFKSLMDTNYFGYVYPTK